MAGNKGMKYCVENLMQCPICLSDADNPTSLPCLHTFCLKCLKELWKNLIPGNEVECPLCRHKCNIPANGVEHFPRSFFVQNLLDMKNAAKQAAGHPLCEVCSAEYSDSPAMIAAATMFCVDCSQQLCDSCCPPHKRWRGGPHDVKELSTTDEASLSRMSRSFCDQHKEEFLKLYCFDCKVNMCLMCSAVNHRNHKCQEITVLVEEFKTEIDVDIKKIDERSRQVHFEEHQLEQVRSELLKVTDSMHKQIQQKGTEMKQLIDKQVGQLCSELEAEKQKTVKEIDQRKDVVELAKTSLESYKKFASEFMAKAKPSDITHSANDMKLRAKQLLQANHSSEAYVPPELSFKPVNNDDIIKTLANGTLIRQLKTGCLETTFSYTVHNVGKLKNKHLSPSHVVGNLMWNIMVMLSSDEKQEKPTLGFFLQCSGDNESESWPCNVTAKLKLLNHKPGGMPLVRDIKHTFCSADQDWGFRSFINLTDLLDPKQGYINDDSVILEVYLKADTPRGVSSDRC